MRLQQRTHIEKFLLRFSFTLQFPPLSITVPTKALIALNVSQRTYHNRKSPPRREEQHVNASVQEA